VKLFGTIQRASVFEHYIDISDGFGGSGSLTISSCIKFALLSTAAIRPLHLRMEQNSRPVKLFNFLHLYLK
jgi:hypothetical protein